MSKISTTQIEMNSTQLTEQPRDAINVTQPWRQDWLNITPWPESRDSISRVGSVDEHVNDDYERFRFDVRSEEQSMTRFYEDDIGNRHP